MQYLCTTKVMRFSAFLLSVYMMVVSLAPNFGGRELFKLPVLVQHYLMHSAKNSNITIAEFFKIHYFEDKGPDSDYHQDKQLPFKSANVMLQTYVAFIPVSFSNFAVKPVAMQERKLVVADALPPLSQLLSNIWQPPKA